MTLTKARISLIVNYDHNCSFIVLANVITIVNYNSKTFIVQAIGVIGATTLIRLAMSRKTLCWRHDLFTNAGLSVVMLIVVVLSVMAPCVCVSVSKG